MKTNDLKTNDLKPYLHHCRKVSRERMQATRLVGRGMKFQFTGKDQRPGTLTLRHIQHTDVPLPQRWTSLHTACGVLHIAQSSAESLLSIFSAAPFAPETDPIPPASTMPWFVELYNHHLYADFRQLLGTIESVSVSAPVSQEITENLYELTWQQGACGGLTQIILSPAGVKQWLTRQSWHPVSRLISELHLTRALTLGKIHLQLHELQNLGIGDILIPTRPYFSTQGTGQFHIGPYLLQLCAVTQGTISAYEITHIHKVTSEETSMNDEYNEIDETEYDDMRGDDYLQDDHDFPTDPTAQDLTESETQQHEIQQDSQHQPHDVLSQIWATPAILTLQAGQIRLTLDELSQLHEGSVLVATGESPGHATLYHGRQPVATGELVDVVGQLGIQITNVFMGHPITQAEKDL